MNREQWERLNEDEDAEERLGAVLKRWFPNLSDYSLGDLIGEIYVSLRDTETKETTEEG